MEVRGRAKKCSKNEEKKEMSVLREFATEGGHTLSLFPFVDIFRGSGKIERRDVQGDDPTQYSNERSN